MRDDFAALDLFSAADKKARKKLLGLPRRKLKNKAKKKPLAAALIAKIKKKQQADAIDIASLQGWAISLSWSAPKPQIDLDAEQAYPLRHSS